jgi:aminoglycoside phosphotransferase (APT) family kinase protein
VVRDPSRLDLARHELIVARWLLSEGVPVVRPFVDVPVVVDGCVVSFWEYLADARSADLVTLASCLRRLHAVPRRHASLLTRVEPFAYFDERLAAAPTLGEADRAFLTELRDKLAAEWARATFDLGDAVIHGDAHMDNLMKAADGRLAFIDLETVCIGPPEWDLTLTALYHESGWFSADEYAGFVGAYGYDVRHSAAWPVLRSIRMLRMTTWLAQSAGDYPEREDQLRHRIATLRDGSAPAGWTGF